MLKKLLQPFFISLTALIFTFLFFIFKEYYNPIFAIRIFFVHVLGLLGVSYIYFLIKPNNKSIIKRSLLIVLTYFSLFELADYLIFFSKYNYFGKRSLSDFIEAETAVITFIATLLIAFFVRIHQSRTDKN
jgi:hypothetical protein